MAKKEKADSAAYQKLKKDIADGTIGRLYVFYGEEAYRRVLEQLDGAGFLWKG